jgi:hypothetical protein
MPRRFLWVVAVIAVLFMLSAWWVLERPASAAGRAQQFARVNLALVLFPLLASVAAFGAAGAYGPGDRERTVWLAFAAACLAQCVGRAVFAYHQLRLGQPAPFPSVADVFTVASGLLVLVGLVTELGLVREVVQLRQVVGLAVLALLALLVGGSIFLAPLLQAGIRGIREAVSLLFSLAGILLVPLALLPAVVFRGGLVGYAWLLVSGAVVCLGLWVLWFTNAVFYGLWFEGHPSNVLQLLAFALLAIGALWHRTAMLQEA